MVEIYKKYVLVSLIVHGEIIAMPKYTSSILQRMLKVACVAYQEIATAFATNKVRTACSV